jgi:hypothetical protein
MMCSFIFSTLHATGYGRIVRTDAAWFYEEGGLEALICFFGALKTAYRQNLPVLEVKDPN